MVAMGQTCNFVRELKPTIIMVIVQMAFAAVNVFYKLAAADGMSLKIIVAYRFLFASVAMAPVALIRERKSRPKLTWMVLFHAFLCGLLGGSLAQNLYIQSLALTSATFASAMSNLIPVITFILAISFGFEKLGLNTLSGKAKVLGTLMGIGGAMVLTFYKGVEIDIWSTHVDLLHQHGHLASLHAKSGHHLMLGALFSIGSCFSYALWLIVQTKLMKIYPCPYSSTALMSLMGTIQAVVFALCTVKDRKQWKLGWNIRLLSVAFTGIVGSGLMVTLIAWCVRMRGPLFVSVFNPLMLVLVALIGSFALNEQLHLGSVLGAILIVAGLYVVLWGKGKEMKKITQLVPSSSAVEIVVTSPINNNNAGNKEPSKDQQEATEHTETEDRRTEQFQ